MQLSGDSETAASPSPREAPRLLEADGRSEPFVHPVPPRALALSVGALLVSVVAGFIVPEALADYGLLVWLLALVPAFLLCHYRGWRGIMLMLAVAMVVLTLSYVMVILLGWQPPAWPLFLFVVAAYIGIALGLGWYSEVRAAVTQRTAAEAQLRLAFEDIRKSHADLKLAQWQLIEAEKLEAVGRLAAGVAHEVKNPLMTLLTGVDYLSKYVRIADENVKILLDDMREAVKRADAVIMGLLDFSAPRELNAESADLNALVNGSAKLVKHEFDRSQITFVNEPAADLPPLKLDRAKIQQVLVNVLTNAAHATPSCGTVTARTFLTPLSLVGGSHRGHDAGQVATGEHAVVVQVDDTGPGIPEEKLHKVFDPFFTTKPAGKGTGLGLSVCRQIIEIHGATIDISNRDECGARVTIVFRVPGKAD